MMASLTRRLAALEMLAPSSLDHLTDEQIVGRCIEIWTDLAAHGLRLPDGWLEQCRSGIVGVYELDRAMRPQLEAMLCEA